MSNEALGPALCAVAAAAPHAALADKLHLYGQFVGSWDMDVDCTPIDGTPPWSVEGEIHFDWALQGAAIQDVFLMPARRPRKPGESQPWFRYGNTLRWYDRRIDAWHITYFDPLRGVETRQIGRQVGDEIVQIGDTPDGLMRRWRFTEIAGDRFRWLGDVSWDRGASWMLEMEMRARRVGRTT